MGVQPDPYDMPSEDKPWEKTEAQLEKEDREAAALEVQVQRALEERCRAVMATEEGRNWVWDLLCQCGIYRVSHVPGDPTQSAFNEGGRNIGLMVLAELKEQTPDLCDIMEQQQRTR